jgi:hypothetical protein
LPGRPLVFTRTLEAHDPTQQYGNFLGVDLVVFGLATMDRFHIEGIVNLMADTRIS